MQDAAQQIEEISPRKARHPKCRRWLALLGTPISCACKSAALVDLPTKEKLNTISNRLALPWCEVFQSMQQGELGETVRAGN